MIELKNVSKYYNTDNIVTVGLSNINLKLNKNEIVAIVGDSGAGKSTLLNVICGVDSYEDGELLFKGNETSYFNQSDMDIYRKEHIAFIFQNYNIIDSYSVLDNVMAPMLLKNVSYKDAKEKALKIIEQVGLSKRIHNKGIQLSGGEKQRCVIARALASDCEILACDEPTGNLDSKSGKEIINLIKEIAKDKLVLIVTHNYDEVKDIVTRKIKISDGKIVEDTIIKTIEEDKNELVEFEPSIIKNKTLLRFAIKNLFSTPKKTIFTFLVFTIMSLIAFYLYLSCTASSEISFFNDSTSFINYESNRLIVYEYNHNTIDEGVLSKISGDYYINSFYEDEPIAIKFCDPYTTSIFKSLNSVYSRHSLTYTHICGKELADEKDCYMIFPKDQLDTLSLTYTSLVSEEYKVLINTTYYDFVGFGVSDMISKPVIQTKADLTEYFSSRVFYSKLTLDVLNNDSNETLTLSYRNSYVKNFTITLPVSWKDKNIDFDLILSDLYHLNAPDESEIDINYISTSLGCYFSLPSDYILDYKGIYEISIYADDPIEEQEKFESLGLNVIRPSVEATEISKNQLLYYAYVIVSTLIILVISFVSYIILSRIYILKNKDYTVLRMLGIIRQKMSRIVTYEILFVALAASIFSFGIIYALYYIFNVDYLNVVTYNSLGISLFYYAIIILFSYLIARRFNKKIFKFSVKSSLENEGSKK